MKNIIVFFLLLCENLIGQSVNLNIPPQQVEIFLKDQISTGLNERDLAISLDMKEIYFTVVNPLNSFSAIFYIKKQASGNWTKPKIAPFSGKYSDLEPSFSPDGKRLYFASKRPIKDEIKKNDFDIWFTEKQNGGWSEPKRLDNTINTEMDEFYPSIATNGNLYFTASYLEPESKEDIFISRFENGKYIKPEVLDSTINSKSYEFNAFIAPDESYLLFTAYGRKGDKGSGDLYISLKKGGKWQVAKPISAINSERLDYCPSVSADGKILFFTSERSSLKTNYIENSASYEDFINIRKSPENGLGDIYWVSFHTIFKSEK